LSLHFHALEVAYTAFCDEAFFSNDKKRAALAILTALRSIRLVAFETLEGPIIRP